MKKSGQKLVNVFFPLMTTFCNFALKIETSWAHFGNLKCLQWCFCVCLVYSFSDKKFINMQCKKEQGVQRLKAFVFCVATVNHEHAKSTFKRKLSG